MSDTIFALATGRGKAGVAVFRISGPDASSALIALTGGDLPTPRSARLRWLKDPLDGERLDQALILWFAAPASFTGEDVAELQVHGGAAVIQSVARALNNIPGLRPAEAGEFTRRAFANGRMDLTSIEGLGDLINAETDNQRRQAVRQMGGDLEKIYEDWRRSLIHASAMIEASIDFADEDVPDDVALTARPVVKKLSDEIQRQLSRAPVGERVRDGLTVAILGAPNAGKSSLLNALAKRDVAIVSDIAGTTRDVIEVHLDLNGYPITLLDTAGLHETADFVEREGIRRAVERASHADIQILLVDAESWPCVPDELKSFPDGLTVINKIDAHPGIKDTDALLVSARTGQGLDALIEQISFRADSLFSDQEPAIITRERHRKALEACIVELRRYLEAPEDQELALLAENLRMAARALGRVTGRVDVEDLLDVIFSEFCIGK